MGYGPLLDDPCVQHLSLIVVHDFAYVTPVLQHQSSSISMRSINLAMSRTVSRPVSGRGWGLLHYD